MAYKIGPEDRIAFTAEKLLEQRNATSKLRAHELCQRVQAHFQVGDLFTLNCDLRIHIVGDSDEEWPTPLLALDKGSLVDVIRAPKLIKLNNDYAFGPHALPYYHVGFHILSANGQLQYRMGCIEGEFKRLKKLFSRVE